MIVEILLWIAGIVLLVVFVITLFSLIKTTTQVVPQEEQLVIYRLGRFNRIAGPGPVSVIPGLEEVVQTIDVRDRPLEIKVPGIFAFGVPNDLTLNLWCSSDLVKATKGDHDKLAKLVQLSEFERHEQVKVKMREALVSQVAHLQEQMPLPVKAKLTERIIALAPGTPHYNTLIKGLKHQLERTLPSVGVVLNTDQSIVLTGRSLSDEIIEAIGRRQGREIDSEWLTNYADELRQRFPEMSNVMLAQILSSVEGVDAGKVQRLLLEQEATTEAEVEFEMSGSGESGPNIITKPKPQKRQPAQAPRPLTKSDLTVLKRVPRGNPDQRLSA
jgi:hypothetical protein